MASFHREGETRVVARDEDGRAYCEAQLALLGDGWTRERPPIAEPIDDELERALHANPDDDATWLVYADHYIEHGHPRGQIMAIESAPVKNVVHRAEREAQGEQLRVAAGDLLAFHRTGVSTRWRRGFIYEARLHGGHPRGDLEDLLWELLAHASARFLRELVIDCWHQDGQDHRLIVALVLHAAPPLRKLVIEYDPSEWVGFAPLGVVGHIGGVFPRLEELALATDETIDLRGLAMPHARRFVLTTNLMRRGMLDPIAAAPWPELVELGLTFGRDCKLEVESLDFVFSLPKLRTLRLNAAPFGNAIVERFVASPIAARVTRLELRNGLVDDAGVEMLVAARDRLPEKFYLDIYATRVTSDGRDMLAEANIDYERWWW